MAKMGGKRINTPVALDEVSGNRRACEPREDGRNLREDRPPSPYGVPPHAADVEVGRAISDDVTAKPPVDTWPEGVYSRGDRLWVSYYAPGDDGRMRQVREAAKRADGDPARTVKEAVKYREERREEVAMHRRGVRQFQGPRTERMLFTELLDAYTLSAEIHKLNSLPQIRSRMKRLHEYFAGYRALAVTSDALMRYVRARQADGAATATINREMEVISRAFALAVAAGKLAFAPKVPSLREDNARQGFFDRADFEAVLTHIADADVCDFVEWFFLTGMRPKEIRSLTWADFDTEAWTLRLHAKDAKTRYGRVIPLENDLRTIIERRIKARRLDCPFIFHRGGKRMGEFRKTWLSACKAAGFAVTVERDGKKTDRALKLVYDLRRTALRNMVRAGVDPAVAMKISGHRTRATFDRYNIISEDDIRAAVRKTSAYVASLPTTSNVVPLRADAGARQ